MVAGVTSRHSTAAASLRAQPALEQHSSNGLIDGAPGGRGGGRFPPAASPARPVRGGEDGGEAVSGQGRGRGRCTPVLKQPPKIGGEGGIGGGIESAPGVELA